MVTERFESCKRQVVQENTKMVMREVVQNRLLFGDRFQIARGLSESVDQPQS